MLAVAAAPSLARRLVNGAVRFLAGVALLVAGFGAGLFFLIGALTTGRTGFLAASIVLMLGATGAGGSLISTILPRPPRPRAREVPMPRAPRAPTSGYQAYGVAIAVFGAIVGIGVVRAGARSFFVGDGLRPMRLAWYSFLVLLVMPVLVAVHELGHAAAAKFSGVRFESLRVGPIELRRDAGRWRVVWKRVGPEDAYGVFCGRGDDWTQAVAISIAGPLATAAAACACVAAALALGEGRTLGTAIAVDALWVAAVVGSVDAIRNLVPRPAETGRLLSDGTRLALALQFGRRADHLQARFLAARRLGSRPRDFGLDAVECLKASDAEPRCRWLLLAALHVANDRGNTALAREVLARALEEAPLLDPLRIEFELAQALDDALRGEPAAARARLRWLGWLVTYPTSPDQPALAEAAILTAERRYDDAHAALERWNRAVQREGAHMRVGNEWAEEALRTHLAAAASGWRN